MDNLASIKHCLAQINANASSKDKDKDYKALWCTSRLSKLWSTLQLCAKSYQSLQQTQQSVTEHFEQLIKVIIAQEHKVKTPINVQMSLIQSTINDIINEIKDINHIINIDHLDDKNNKDSHSGDDDDDDERTSKVIESIKSCESIDQFIKIKLCQPSSYSDNPIDNADDGKHTQAHDHELLSMIRNHSQHTHQVPYDNTYSLKDVSVKIDDVKLKRIKRQIESCFKLITPPPSSVVTPKSKSTSTSYNNVGHIMMLGCLYDECHLLSLETSDWTKISSPTGEPLEGITTSMVYARGSVYLFGGDTSPTTYYQLSLEDKQWDADEIVGVGQCRYTSACFDGRSKIYLVGGYVEGECLRRVDSFDLERKEFDCVGELSYGVAHPITFYHNDNIYIVCGDCSDDIHGIYTFNVITKRTSVVHYLREFSLNQHDKCCFDGVDNIFIHTNRSFIRYTLSTNQMSKLAMLKNKQVILRMERPMDHS
ncbi:hypothetical protein SAMD00019534_022750 [Acytostelium subglobosum LB1]|uniref:hypothetical protein n=1 Tax=Acytostelium subglobosum LB1 TaxID=1410327 RepID=UPI000644C751|nr:hypothetical protein SAMD00019534_022750 [Acytostelium subglobosum LB1]GAM19100.1 hypothetical protein SAMD00019534_022750 [Acytostelium subglobosum LB1]|eukprot:XP_012757027.1 hypothetical protein SAMD00019534_022750 [Acytostelium subglobosum LB1]